MTHVYFLLAHGDRNIFFSPIVNPFDVCEIYVHATMAHHRSKIIMPWRVVDVDVWEEAQVVGNNSQIVPRTFVMHLGNLGEDFM